MRAERCLGERGKKSRELAEGGPDVKRWWVVAGGLRPRKRK